jgi:hypothetical protein
VAVPRLPARLPTLPRVPLPPDLAATFVLYPGEVPAAVYSDHGGHPLIVLTNQRFLYTSGQPKKRAKHVYPWKAWALEEIRDLKLMTRTKSGGLVVIALIPIPTPGSVRYFVQVNGVDFEWGSETTAKDAFRLIAKARLFRMVELRRATRRAQG